MKGFKNHLIAASGFVALALTITFANSNSASAALSAVMAEIADVRVVNTREEPVPTFAVETTTVNGSVSIAGTPTVKLQTGTIVGINPASNTVQLANTTASPVPVLNVNDASQPFQAIGSITQNSGTNASTIVIANVPAGKRLVIEHISATGEVPSGQRVTHFGILTLTLPVGGLNHDLLVNEQPAAADGDAVFRASQQVRLYAEPGSQVQTTFIRNISTGQASFHMVISGYLVNVP